MSGSPAGPPLRLAVLDTTAYLFRSFHAIRDLRTREGVPTNAVYGLAMTLAQLRDRLEGVAFACVMDAPGPTFRHELYPDYKATRKETDPDLIRQIEPAKRLITALGMQLYCVGGVEADDVIASIATRARAAGVACTIATSDKDLMYLAGQGCTILDPMRNQELDAAGVTRKYGVPPARMLDYLSLVGDTADNVPGVPGVGPKTAVKWLRSHGDLAGIIAHRHEITGKVGERLRASLDQLQLAQDLIQLREDVALEPDPLALAPPTPDQEALAQVCADLRFNDNLRARLQQAAPVATPVPVVVTVLTEAAQFHAAARQLATAVNVGLHVETSGMDAPSASLVSVALHGAGHDYYVPLDHPATLAEPVAETQAAHAFLREVLAAADREVRLFEAKQAQHALANLGIPLACRWVDVGLMAYCEGSGSGGEIASVARRFLDYGVPTRAELIGGRDKPKEFRLVSVAAASGPACQWARAAHDLREQVCTSMPNHSLRLFRQVEMPALPALMAMERNGIALDEQRLARLDGELTGRLDRLAGEIAAAAGVVVNLNSPTQLASLLYDQLGLDAGHKTRQGARSTNETELARLARDADSPIPRLVLDYRHAAKLSGTYTATLPQRINPATGRVHTHFIQAGAITGRLASKDPNLQNIPVRSADGHRIRQCFVAPRGKVLLAADYSQIELRILAHLSGDRTLLDSFAAGEDVHQRTAAEVYGVAPDQVDTDMRNFAKTINFGLIYGMGAFGLARRLGISQAAAKEMIATYFDRLPGVRDFLATLKEEVATTKVVTTLHGRTISVSAVRAALNAPMQGAAADIMKLAMTAVHQGLGRQFPAALLLLQVHDELVLEVPVETADEVAAWLPRAMGAVADLAVPLTVDVGRGDNWDEAH